ncbi:MAG: hypothetical protein HY000_15140 [Planctomycetes bacterium]|nr:hypothetical protein [Planctomycetota bacterium]
MSEIPRSSSHAQRRIKKRETPGVPAGTQFEVFGTRGTLDLGHDYANPVSLTISAEGATQETGVPPREIQPDPGEDHMSNWLTCLRTRGRPNADIQFGHQHAIATILAATALETGRRQKYDPQKREMHAG